MSLVQEQVINLLFLMERKFWESVSTMANSKFCANCPRKLYHKDKDQANKIKLGIGNIYSGTVLILPPHNILKDNDYNYTNKVIDIVKKAKDIYLPDIIYITRLFKCSVITDYNIKDICVDTCAGYLIMECKSATRIINATNVDIDYFNTINIPHPNNKNFEKELLQVLW